MTTEAEAIQALLAMMKGIGPKTVQTPNMTVTTHDPKDVQHVMERRMAVAPTMCSLQGCVGTPKLSAFEMHKNIDCGCKE